MLAMVATQTNPQSRSMVEDLVGETDRFKATFLKAATIGLAAIAAITLPLSAMGANPATGVIACGLGMVVCAIAYALTRAGRLFVLRHGGK